MESLSEVRWHTRSVPLQPDGVVARGSASSRLAHRLLAGPLDGLSGVCGPDLVAVLGEALPWVDGVVYLGAAPAAPGLYLPTFAEPDLHPQLVLNALRLRGVTGPVALLPQDGVVLPLSECRPIVSSRLHAWLRGG